MAFIDFQKVYVDLPVYNASGRSLKSKLLKTATGGRVNADEQGRVIVRALEDVSFQIRDGERVGLLGHNGAGKTTLLRVLSGVYHPSSGNADINGEIGSLIDISLGIDPEATGRENIFIRGGLLGMKRKEIADNLESIINFSELGDFIDMPLRTYSTGMHLRLAFSVSTILRPEILLMDEWLSVGDESFRNKMQKRMNELVHSSNILVIASHSQELLRQICNRIIWFEHGKIKKDGEAAAILDEYFSI